MPHRPDLRPGDVARHKTGSGPELTVNAVYGGKVLVVWSSGGKLRQKEFPLLDLVFVRSQEEEQKRVEACTLSNGH
jgi:hypothetical protein